MFTKWSLTGGGYLREVVAMRELTVVIFVVMFQLLGLYFSFLMETWPLNLHDNFKVLMKCRSKLECLIFEMLLTPLAGHFLFKFAPIILNYIMYFFFTHLFLYKSLC